MNKEQYIKQRNELMTVVENLINEGKIEESEAKMQEVKDLDNKWEGIKLANANLNALKDNQKITDIDNKSVNVKDGVVVDKTQVKEPVNEKDLYVTAWAKKLLKADMTKEETEIFNKVNDIKNAYTHTTSLTTLIPETVVKGIEKLMKEQYPLLADVRKFNVKGNLTMNKHKAITAGDADWYLEATPVADEQNEFEQFKLTGHELAKAVTVSWKMQSMSVEEFLPFIQQELADRMGIAKAAGVANGTGTNQPKGIVPTLEEEASTPRVVEYTMDGDITYANITDAISKVHSSLLGGSYFYANNTTVWTKLATIMDGMGRPLFIPDTTSGGIGRILGFTVKVDGSLEDGKILFGNANKGYIMNTNEPMKLVSEDHAKQRETDYVSYEITDGDVYEISAFSLLKEATV